MKVQEFEVRSEKRQICLKDVTKAQRTYKIIFLKKQIKQLKKFYSPEKRITVINVDTGEEKILSKREKREILEEKLSEIYGQLDSLRWKDRRCRICDRLESQTEFAEGKIVCNSCQIILTKAPEPKVCAECFKRFYVRNNHQIYCSYKCQNRAKMKEKVELETK